MMLYINTATGTIEEVDGDSYLINTNTLSTAQEETIADLDAEEMLEFVNLIAPEVVEEIAR